MMVLLNPIELASLIFTGRDGQECEDFITSLTRFAYENGQLRDNDWLVDMARLSFRGKALRWFVNLDEDVQTSWRLLQQAMVREYPPPDYSDQPQQ